VASSVPPVRTLLFAPATHERRLARLPSCGADATVIDLEDAVADEEKVGARRLVPPALARGGPGLRCVRINGLDTGLMFDDLAAVAGPHLDAVVVPKVDSPDLLRIVDAQLGRLEAELGLTRGTVGLFALIETARGIQCAGEIALAAPDRVRQLVFGLGDFSADVGVEPSEQGLELLYARSALVVASRAAGLPAPLDGPHLRLHDPESLDADTRRSKALGLRGRVVIHPEQVAPVHRVISTLSEAELHRAQRVVNEFERAEAAGNASITVDGGFVDYPIYRQRLEQLEQHRRATDDERAACTA